MGIPVLSPEREKKSGESPSQYVLRMIDIDCMALEKTRINEKHIVKFKLPKEGLFQLKVLKVMLL